jgi:type IV secretory pathway VirB2 component (pilin)
MVLSLASWSLAAGGASADVLDIAPDGVVTRNIGPAVYLTTDLKPLPLTPPSSLPRRTEAGGAPHAAPSQEIALAISAESSRFGLNPRLVEAVAWRESGFDNNALSPKGARGVMQLMPDTALALRVDPDEPGANVHGGAAYLSWLLGRYDGDVIKSLAAYNAGPAAVDRYGGLPPYRETRAYVQAVLNRYFRMTSTPHAVRKPQDTPVKHPVARVLAAAAPVMAATPAFAQTVSDPAGSGPILAALQWVQGTLLGTLATTAAVIAVAVVGLMMLTGRIEWRRGITVVLGAFIIFGAVAIVAGMRSIASGAG